MFPKDTLMKAQKLLEACKTGGLKVATVESCTGGLISSCLTAVPGSSDVVDRTFVTYTNEAKTEMVGVPTDLFDEVGAVSEEVARAMAEGALEHSNAEVSGSATGIAGPGGGSDDKPVGLVHMAAARKGYETEHLRYVFKGDRDSVRLQAVGTVIDLMRRQAELP
ncbi:MAG: CinA family protein [Rhodospirillaceae bacterium]|jgi:nicotinamide-nucleotide amidase|nr:CinA family protein [Rhodospirillales bacterium]MBT3907375.1 CinA family protein [Rhodospirillaceae bacterium]MBT4701680.1 CinA family protein [Rhodospirillaceae bacterium]MBT5035043.1 CinA family protein [Rhodospirillaceae bacterium]MBT6221820.1 CinA family protein [Rhodospirillaceae bacterium]